MKDLQSTVSSNTFIRSAENDRPVKCAGDAMRRCLVESMQVYEHELENGDPEAGDDANNDYAVTQLCDTYLNR